MRWYFEVLKRYAVFRGRAQRTEFWCFFLFNLIALVAITALDIAISFYVADSPVIPLTMLYLFAVLMPAIAVSVRRLHDTGRSGRWMFITLVPIIGAIVVLVFMARDSEPGENIYGQHPSTVIEAQDADDGDTVADEDNWHEEVPRAWAIPSFTYAIYIVPNAIADKLLQAITLISIPLLIFSWRVWRKPEKGLPLFYSNGKRTGWVHNLIWLVVTLLIFWSVFSMSLEFMGASRLN